VRAVRRPRFLLVASVAVAAALLAPLVFLAIESAGSGLDEVSHLIFRSLTATLLWNTVRLTVVVTFLCAVIGTLAAWCVERTDLPGRRIWAVLLVVPFAIPDFVVSFGWASLSTWVHGFRGAVLVMTLAVYPLVYLPVAASLRASDAEQEEVARSLGMGRVRTFFRITVGQAKGAILGGCLLVALVMLAEYGAFEILGYPTFTTEIFTEFSVSFNLPVASALVWVLVLLGLIVLAGESVLRGRTRVARIGPQVQRASKPHHLGRATLPVLLGLGTLVGLALGVPVASCFYWTFDGGPHALTGVGMASATWHTVLYSGSAAGLATLLALPVAILSVRYPGSGVRMLERSTYLVLAMPGVVVAFALSYFSLHYAGRFYLSAPLLIFAYAILFFPLALVGVKASVAHAPAELEEVARSLGEGRLAVFRRVTLPLIGPGLAAAFCLVLLAGVTELTATLLMVPNGVQTLSTQFWAYQQNLSYGQAAPFALMIIGIAAVPSYILGRFFDRLPAKATNT
jgi:iron(III) transport system permease protein